MIIHDKFVDGVVRFADPDSFLLGHVRLGAGPVPVVVLHEWFAHHINYEPMSRYLDRQRFTYFFADLRGYGLSRHLSGEFTAAEASADTLRLMTNLGHTRFCVIGHSMSGMIAQRIAVDAPDRVIAMVLISPVPAGGFPVDAAGFGRMAASIEDDEAARNAIRSRTGDRYGGPWLERKIAILRAGTETAALRGYLRMFTGTDFSAAACGLGTPILVLVGEHDLDAYKRDHVQRVFEPLYPNLQIKTSREAGHYMMLETPVLAATEIERFLGQPGREQ